MFLFKRLLTTAVLFVGLFVLISLLALVVMGGIAGIQATGTSHATDFASGYAAGHDAGAAMGRKYGPFIMLGSLVVSGIIAGALSFSRVFPWCRPKTVPPPLPEI